jgi:hypothetical protein
MKRKKPDTAPIPAYLSIHLAVSMIVSARSNLLCAKHDITNRQDRVDALDMLDLAANDISKAKRILRASIKRSYGAGSKR